MTKLAVFRKLIEIYSKSHFFENNSNEENYLLTF